MQRNMQLTVMGGIVMCIAALPLSCNIPPEADGDDAQQPREEAHNVEQEHEVQKATFGAGCFWGVEYAFRHTEGVTDTAVGYMGGGKDNPTYQEVCSDRTGHAEVVQITYDPDEISYEELLELFWELHDPTLVNRQGPDVGSQYRSAIFFHTPEQEVIARASKKALDDSGAFRRPIATTIEPAPAFWPAEEYHQQYFEKKGIVPTCHR